MKFSRKAQLLLSFLPVILWLGSSTCYGVAPALSLPAAQTPDFRKLQADRVLLQGLDEFQSGQMRAAVQFWEQAWKSYEQLGDLQGQEIALICLGKASGAVAENRGEDEYRRYLDKLKPKVQERTDPFLSLVGLSLAYNLYDKENTKVPSNIASREYLRLAKARINRDRANEQLALVGLGDAYITMGEPAKAVKVYQEGLQVAQSPTSDTSAELLRKLGKTYYLLGENARALEYHQRNLAGAYEQENTAQIQEALLALGRTYASLGEYPTALSYYQQGYVAKDKPQDVQRKALAILGQSYVAATEGDYLRAIELRQESADIIGRQQAKNFFGTLNNIFQAIGYISNLSQIGSPNYKSNAFQNLSLSQVGSWVSNGRVFIVFVGKYTDNLKISNGTYDRQVTTGLFGLGRSFTSQGEYAKAIEYYEQSLALARQANDQPRERAALVGLSEAYAALGETARAKEYYQKNIAIAKDAKARQGEPDVNTQFKIAYRALGDYERAINAYQKSLDLAKQVADRRDEANALAGLGSAYSALGEAAKAREYYEQSLAIWQSLSVDQAKADRTKELTLLISLADTDRTLGELDQAIITYQKGLKLAQDLDDKATQQFSLTSLGKIYVIRNELPKATLAYGQSLKLAQEAQDKSAQQSIIQLLGNALFASEKYDLALQKYQESLAIAKEQGNQPAQLATLSDIGKAYIALNNPQAALEQYQAALEIARKTKNRSATGALLSNLGYLQYKNANLAAAEKLLLEAIQVRESLRKGLQDTEQVAIFETQRNAYNTLQKVLINRGQTDAALAVAERGRSRAFVELLAKRLANQPSVPVETTAAPNLERIRQIAKEQNATLVQYSIIEDEVAGQGKLQLRETELYIWVVAPTGNISFRRVDLKPLQQQSEQRLSDLVITHQQFIGVRGRDRSPQATSVKPIPAQSTTTPILTQLLIEPIADLLPTDPQQTVIFIPQGPLFSLDFPALQTRNGEYLIQKHTIVTAPSIQVLDFTHQRSRELQSKQAKSSPRSPLIVGNPAMPGSLLPLPGAEQEAKAIATLLKTTALTGKDATKATILERLPDASMIHFATHGLLNNVRSLDSSIALTPSETDTGFLTAEEILNLRLQADLVVLSACNTGQGKITGDGVMGLSRSFISAGVPSVIVSLWAVPDSPTAALMAAFYKNWQTQPNKAQALRQAMLTTMKTYPDPKDWAAFMLIGEAN